MALFVCLAVVAVAAFWFVVAALDALLSPAYDWFLSRVSEAARSRRLDRQEHRRQEWSEFMAAIQPLDERCRRPYHNAENRREYRRLMREDMKGLRAKERRRSRL